MTTANKAPLGATHYEPFTMAYYKKEKGTWYVFSRIEREHLHWTRSPGTCEKCLLKISDSQLREN